MTPYFIDSFTLLFQVGSGGTLAVFKPVRQPPFPTPERVIESVPTLKITILFAIPVFLEVRYPRAFAMCFGLILESTSRRGLRIQHMLSHSSSVALW